VAAASPSLRFDANLGWLFTELPFEARFEAAATAGFLAVEYPAPYRYSAARLRLLLAGAGLHQVLINTPTGTGLACRPDRVGEFRAGVELGLEYATTLQSDFLHVVGGVCPSDVSHDVALAQYVANVAWAAERAGGTGVRLVLEMQNQTDVPGFILDSVQRAVEVIDEVGAENVGLLLDVYHVWMQGLDPVAVATSVRPQVLHVQIADPPGRGEPGSGEISWPAVFGFLQSSGYQGWIGCEYRPVEGTVPGLQWMNELTA
jgi:hydroxypyruvate isomerase